MEVCKLLNVVEHRHFEGWHYLKSHSNILSENHVMRHKNIFIYNPNHANPQIVEATKYDIMCGSQVAIPAGKRAIVTLTSYTIGRPNSRWSIKLLDV